MKKYGLAFCITALIWTTIPAFAADETDSNTLDFLTVLSIPKKEDATLLTLEDAITKAVKNSTELKTSNLNIALSETKSDRAAAAYINSVSGQSLSNLLNLVKQNASYANSVAQRQVQEQSLIYSMKKTYIEIINLERDLELQKMSAKNADKELAVTKVKNNLGLISDKELLDAQTSYQKTLSEIQSKQSALSEAYDTLDVLIGNKDAAKYQIVLEPEYTPVELSTPLEAYANSKVSADPNIETKEREVSVAKKQLQITAADASTSIDSEQEADNNLAAAQMSLSDSKETLTNKIKSCYNNLIAIETEYQNGLLTLENLKKEYEIAQNKLDMGIISEIEAQQCRIKVAQQESSLIEKIYEHMLFMEQFENSYLL